MVPRVSYAGADGRRGCSRLRRQAESNQVECRRSDEFRRTLQHPRHSHVVGFQEWASGRADCWRGSERPDHQSHRPPRRLIRPDRSLARKINQGDLVPSRAKSKSEVSRCRWASNQWNIPYHDAEWGVPVHDERLLFEFLILEGAQAGLSWDTILRKRERYREVLDNFDVERIARYGAKKVRSLLADPGIIRNRLKISATIGNAREFLKVQEEFGSFDVYIWRFVDGRQKLNTWPVRQKVPAKTS